MCKVSPGQLSLPLDSAEGGNMNLMFVFSVLTWNGSKVPKPTIISPYVEQVKLEKFYLHRLLKVEVEQGGRLVSIRPSRLRVLKLLLQQDVERAVLVQGA